MNSELVSETLRIIANRLLQDPVFCGSTEGRRLQQIIRTLDTPLRSQAAEAIAAARPELRDLVTRYLTLPVNLDNRLDVIAQDTGISRNDLVKRALESFTVEGRHTNP